MKHRNDLTDRLFKGAGKDDESFIEALRHLWQKRKPVSPKQEMAVREPTSRYGAGGRSDLDAASCTVGVALHEVMAANGWTKKIAAAKLNVSEAAIEGLLAEMMPLTSKSVRSAARFLCQMHSIASEQILSDYLLNGLHFWELQHINPGDARMAARRKNPPTDKR